MIRLAAYAVTVYLSAGLVDASAQQSRPPPVFGDKWPAPGLDDTQLSKSGLPLELHRAQITDRRVSAFRVVEALDIVKHICLCLIARPVRFVTGALGLQRREEALHRGVVPHIARSAHRTDDAAVGQQPLELLARVLAAAIRVMQR